MPPNGFKGWGPSQRLKWYLEDALARWRRGEAPEARDATLQIARPE
jgi:hypothetical protein